MKSWYLIIGLVVGGTAPAHALLRTYPGAAPCNSTLQACITGASAGDEISITTAAAIDEDLTIAKSLTLRGADGVTAMIGTGTTHRTVSLQDAGSGAATIVVQNIRFDNADVNLDLDQGSGHQVTIAGCTLESLPTGAVSLNVEVPSTVTVKDNFISSPSSVVNFTSGLTSGSATVRIVGNRITTADIFNSGNGVRLQLAGAGSVTTTVDSNVVYGVTGCNCGGASGIYVRPASGTVTGVINIINNTVDNLLVSSGGIRVGAPGATNQLTVNLFNNIVTRASESGFEIDPIISQLTVNAGFNASYGNATPDDFGGYTAGTVLALDPLYVNPSGGNYRLRPESPLINAGTSSVPNGIGSTDAAGDPRVVGPAPDLGAYEAATGASTTTTVSVTTTTTLFGGGCSSGATYTSAQCRLALLRTAVEDGVTNVAFGGRLGTALTKVRTSVRLAEQLNGSGDTKPRNRTLTKASKALTRFQKLLGSRPGQQISEPLRAEWTATSAALIADLGTLAGA